MSDAVLPAPSQVSSGGNFQLPAHPSLYKPIPGAVMSLTTEGIPAFRAISFDESFVNHSLKRRSTVPGMVDTEVLQRHLIIPFSLNVSARNIGRYAQHLGGETPSGGQRAWQGEYRPW